MTAAVDRTAELAANLAAVRDRVAGAARAADRSAQEVTIVAITKTFPASDVRLLAGLGITHVGENRDQEARPKAQACADLGLVWHFVGQLQRNKAAAVATYADVVESVDRARLVPALDRAAGQAGRRLGACVQVDLDERPHDVAGGAAPRGGCAPGELLDLAGQVAASAHLDLLGVMAVAPLGVAAEAAFGRLAQLHERLLAEHPGATMRSAGMSADLEAAIAAGATHVRLGSALLGRRAALK
jgi:pyridoxal phosphate enzyme (YggS family)